MADRRPQVVIVPPGGAGLHAAINKLVTHETVVTALEDSALHSAKQMLGDREIEEYLPFGSCVGRFAAMCGDTGFPRLTGPQSFHLIQRSASELHFDNVLSAAAFSLGLAKNLARTLTELRYHGFRPDDLRQSAEKTADHISAERFKSLAELIEIYEAQCHTHGREFASERAEFCISQSEPRHFTFRHLIIIVSGDRSPIYDQWIQWVASQGIRVDCIVAAWPGDNSPFQYELTWADQLGDVTDWTTELSQNESWTQHLFHRPSRNIPDCPVTARHFTMGDMLSECEWIVREIQSLLRSGTEPGQIGIFIRGATDTIPLLNTAAERFGLLLTGTRSAPLHSNGFVAATLELLRAFASPDIRNLRFAFGNSYFGIPPQDYDDLVKSLYAIQANHPEPWIELMGVLSENPEFNWINHLLEWRKNASESPKTLSYWAENIHTIWSDTPILDNAISGPTTAIRRDQHAWTVMQRTIRDAALSYNNDFTIDLSHFVSLAETIWKEEVVIWEADPGHIRLCTNPNQLVGFEHVFCLQMLEGSLPRRRRQDPVLDDFDRQILNESLPDHPPLPYSTITSARERALFTTLAASAQKSITFSHADAGEERDNIATFYLEEVKSLIPTRSHTFKRSELTPPAPDCQTWPDRTLRDALDSPRTEFTPPELTTEVAQAAARPDFSKAISIQQLAQAAACPFRSVFNHQVIYKAPDRSIPIAIMRTLPKKAQLIHQPSATAARETLMALAKSELEEHLHRLDEWEQILYQDTIDRVVQGWITREFESRQLLNLESYQLVDNFVPRSELKGDPNIQLKFHLDALYQKGPNKIGFLYSGYIPRYLSNKDDIENALLSTLMLYALDRQNQDNVAILVDSLEGDRALLTKRAKIDWLANSTYGTSIFHSPLESKNPEYQSSSILDSLQSEINRAQIAIRKATAIPQNGDHCARCALGDLCRTHNEFGEIQSIFDEAQP
ncbi:hypothetical protein C0431_01815 [bacterium]|nr:hypothetical protein [bacterium]